MLYADVSVPAPFYPSKTLFTYKIPSELQEVLSVGSLVKLSFGRRQSWGIVCNIHRETPDPKIKLKNIDSLLLHDPVFTTKQLGFVEKLAEHYIHPLGLVFEAAIPSPIRNGTLRTLKYENGHDLFDLQISPSNKKLNPSQKNAFDKILASERLKHLLWGITGSGKTEVYLNLIEHVLREGKSGLVLVPEIALTPLLTERFEERFPGQIALFHSAQTPKKLREAWFDIWCGRKRLALGARSALFAPLKNLGIVVVDEEHDASYKQEEGFRYNARDAALMMSEHHQSLCILGSATPSAESIHLSQQGHAEIHLLEGRAVEGSSLPKIHFVDLKKSFPEASKIPHVEIKDEFEAPHISGDFFLSPELRDALDKNLKTKNQSILFINRRGVGSQKLCRSCGHILECPNCDVKLTPHFDKMSCHYCGYDSYEPDLCPSCGSKHPFVQVGIGTEGVEEALKFHYPEARILRMDRDTIQNKNDLEKTLATFSSGEADILVGTQMVAKGHDFPNVTLVGILLADLGMSVPDFRASERILQLLLQVAGRSGRATQAGHVYVQTFQPEHDVFHYLAQDNQMLGYREFIDIELSKRRMLNYPPESSLALLRFDGLDESLVQQAAKFVASTLEKAKAPGLKILGPTSSPLSKLRGRYRKQILLKSPDKTVFSQTLHWLLQGWAKGQCEKNYKTRLLIDVDPVQML